MEEQRYIHTQYSVGFKYSGKDLPPVHISEVGKWIRWYELPICLRTKKWAIRIATKRRNKFNEDLLGMLQKRTR